MKSDRKASTLPKSQIASSDLDPDVLQAALDQAYNAVIVTEAQLDSPGPRIVYANPAFARQTGYPVEELIGQSPRILQGPGPDTDLVMLKELRRRLDQGLSFEGRTINYRKNGQPYHVEWNISPVRNPAGETRYYLSVQHDVSDFIQAQSKLIQRANLDTLTGLVSRNHGVELLERQFKLARRHDQPWSVGMVDIDHFKACNDRYGHAAATKF